MRIDNGKDKIILTEKEATILCKARDIINDIYDETQNDDIIGYTENILDNLNSLLEPGKYDSFEIVQEKQNKNGNVTLVTIEF